MKILPAGATRIQSKIVDYHLDVGGDWVAMLECGRQRHVRHNPPWTQHHWVTTPQGRLKHLGETLECGACSLNA